MRKLGLFGASMLAVTVATPSYAQTAPQAQAADEHGADIIVTATKREQTLQNVPISVAVTDAATVEKSQIRDLIDLQSVVPSLKVTQFQSAGQTNFIIRGFGNGNGNDGIESSVGIFIDGVYRSRSAAALDDLPEIERIEVLRGPQSTLFGKNVSAGAISIVTKRPQFDFGGKAEVTVGNYGAFQTKGTVTGPLSETLAARLSGSFNSRDGYFHNVTTNGAVNDRNRWSVRADLLYKPNSDFSLRLIADYNKIVEVCCGVAQIQNGPATLAIGALGFPIGNAANPFSRNVVMNTDPKNRVIGKGISGQIDYNLGFAKLTSITAYRNQINQSNTDVDFSGADITNMVSANDDSNFTQEIRLASTGSGPISWLIGGFYQDEKLTTGRDIRFGKDTRAFVNALTGSINSSTGVYTANNSLIYALESLQAASGVPGIVPGSTYYGAGQGIADNYHMSQRAYSLFGQVDFKVTPQFTLTGGLGYLNDRKEVQSFVVMNDKFAALNLANVPNLAFVPFALLPAAISGCLLQKGYAPGATAPANLFDASLGASLPGPGSAPCPASRAGVNPFALNALQFFYANTANHGPVNIPNANESGILSGDKLVYSLRAAYDFGRVNAYVSYSTGWKAGAYNLSSDSRPPNTAGVGRSAAPENVTVYEFGLKAKFRGGYANLAVFQESIKGFQSNAFTGLGFDLVNAGKESVRGFELDTAFKPTRDLGFTFAATYLDPKYDSFTGAACVNYDTVRCPVSATTGLIPNTRDLTGAKPAGIPTWSLSASATYSHDFTDNLNAYVRGEWDYTSNTQLTETTPPDLSTWGVNSFNASAGLNFRNYGLELMVWGRNLTNDNYLLSTFPTVAQTGSYSGYPNQPRTFGLTVRKTF